MKPGILLPALLSTLILASCSSDSTPVQPAPTVSFQTDVRGVFNARCVSCHQWGAAGAVLNLKSDSVWMNLVSKRSPNSKTWYYAIYKNRDESLLFRKINDAKPPFGLAMPIEAKLPDAEIEIIGKWIDEGTLNN